MTPVGMHRLESAHKLAKEWELLAIKLGNDQALLQFASQLRQAAALEQLDQLWVRLMVGYRQTKKDDSEMAHHLMVCAEEVDKLLKQPSGVAQVVPTLEGYKQLLLGMAKEDPEEWKRKLKGWRQKAYWDTVSENDPWGGVTPLEDAVLTEVIEILEGEAE
jgi:hypothetical protein